MKADYHIEETIFVGDRGMITKLNLGEIARNGFDYILGVKHRQDEICELLLATEEWAEGSYEWHKDLKIKERRVPIKEFLIWKAKSRDSWKSSKGSTEFSKGTRSNIGNSSRSKGSRTLTKRSVGT